MTDVDVVTPRQMMEMRGALLIDVRDSDYDCGGHLRQAINIPLAELESPEAMGKMVTYETIVCFCQYSRQRGPTAARIIKKHFGDKRVCYCEGGFEAISAAFPDDLSVDCADQ